MGDDKDQGHLHDGFRRMNSYKTVWNCGLYGQNVHNHFAAHTVCVCTQKQAFF